MAARVLDVELTSAPESVELGGLVEAFVVLRVHGHPVGTVRVACGDGVLTRGALAGNVTTYIGVDGLHPNEEGYRRIAEEFFAAIRANLE